MAKSKRVVDAEAADEAEVAQSKREPKDVHAEHNHPSTGDWPEEKKCQCAICVAHRSKL